MILFQIDPFAKKRAPALVPALQLGQIIGHMMYSSGDKPKAALKALIHIPADSKAEYSHLEKWASVGYTAPYIKGFRDFIAEFNQQVSESRFQIDLAKIPTLRLSPIQIGALLRYIRYHEHSPYKDKSSEWIVAKWNAHQANYPFGQKKDILPISAEQLAQFETLGELVDHNKPPKTPEWTQLLEEAGSLMELDDKIEPMIDQFNQSCPEGMAINRISWTSACAFALNNRPAHKVEPVQRAPIEKPTIIRLPEVIQYENAVLAIIEHIGWDTFNKLFQEQYPNAKMDKDTGTRRLKNLNSYANAYQPNRKMYEQCMTVFRYFNQLSTTSAENRISLEPLIENYTTAWDAVHKLEKTQPKYTAKGI